MTIDHDRIGSVSSQGGTGITDALFGGGFTGTLPVTWPRAVTDEPINSGDGKAALFPLG